MSREYERKPPGNQKQRESQANRKKTKKEILLELPGGAKGIVKGNAKGMLSAIRKRSLTES